MENLFTEHLSELITATVAIVSILVTTYMSIRNKELELENSSKERAMSYRKEAFGIYYKEKLSFYKSLTIKIKKYEKELLNEGDEDIIEDYNGGIKQVRGLTKEKIYLRQLRSILEFLDDNLLYIDDNLYALFMHIQKALKQIEFDYDQTDLYHNVNTQDEYNERVYNDTHKYFERIALTNRDYFKRIEHVIDEDSIRL